MVSTRGFDMNGKVLAVGSYYWAKPNENCHVDSNDWEIAQVYADGVFEVFGWIPAPPGVPFSHFTIGPEIIKP